MLYNFYINSSLEYIITFVFLAFNIYKLFSVKKGMSMPLYLLSSTAAFTFILNIPKIIRQITGYYFLHGLPLIFPYIIFCMVLTLSIFSITMLQDHPTTKLFYILYFVNFIQVFKVIFSPLYENSNAFSRTLYIILDLGSFVFLLLALLFLFKLFKKSKINSVFKNLPRKSIMMFYYPLSFLIVYILASCKIPLFSNFAIPISIVIITNLPIVVWFCSEIIHSSEQQKRLDMSLQQAKSQLAKIHFSFETEERIRRERHELQNNYFYIRALLEEKQFDKLSVYLDDKIHNNIEPLFEVFSGNPIMDYILNQKIAEAHSLNIKTYTEVLVPSDLTIIDDSICSILLNILDNAIESAQNENDPDIHIVIKSSGNYLVIKIQNKVSENILNNNPELKSTKLQNHEHGYGIKIIKEAVKSHNGMIDFAYENNYFIVSVLIPMSLELN